MSVVDDHKFSFVIFNLRRCLMNSSVMANVAKIKILEHDQSKLGLLEIDDGKINAPAVPTTYRGDVLDRKRVNRNPLPLWPAAPENRFVVVHIA